MSILKGFFTKDKTQGQINNVTVSEVGDNVGLDVNIVGGGSSGGGGGGSASTDRILETIRDASLVNEAFDRIDLFYNTAGDINGVHYFRGGTRVIQLTLSYTNGILTRIERVDR